MNKTIAIVDDDPLLRQTLHFSLQSQGWQVLEFSSTQEIIASLAQQEEVNVLPVMLLDMGMPPNKHTPEEGLKVLDYVKTHQLPTKVIVLTGQEADQMAYLAISHGAFDFLTKPIEQEALLHSVQRALLFYRQQQKWLHQENKHQVQIEVPMGQGVKPVRNLAEEKIVRKVLQQTGFNVHETARVLGLKRENVYYLIKKYHIQRPGEETLDDKENAGTGA